MSRGLAVLCLLAAIAVGAIFAVAGPDLVVVAPGPAFPIRTNPVTTTSTFSVDQIEEKAFTSIARLELLSGRRGFGRP